MPDALELVLRIALAAVLLVAGTAKLFDRAGAREAARAFGVPQRLAGTVAVALPIAEIVLALLLLPSTTARAAAIAAAVLLAAFTVAIVRVVRRGEAPDCHCFGQLASQPAGPATIVRNALLAVLAIVIAAAASDPSATAWIGRLDGEGVALLAAGVVVIALTAALAWGASTLIGAHGRLLLRVDALERRLAAEGIELEGDDADAGWIGLPLGISAPAFELAMANGEQRSLPALLGGRGSLLLVFTDPECGPCRELVPQALAWDATAVVSSGPVPGADVLLDPDRVVAGAYEAAGTPAAVLVGGDGAVASQVVYGADAIRALHEERAETLLVGTPAPPLELPVLDGPPLDLSEPAGTPRLLLFWNPDCGFCSAMRDDLLRWELERDDDAPDLVVVGSGDPARLRAEGFASTVALDDEFSAGAAFGVGGTPMAVLLDGEGRVAAPVAAGADEVLRLAAPGRTANPVRVVSG